MITWAEFFRISFYAIIVFSVMHIITERKKKLKEIESIDFKEASHRNAKYNLTVYFKNDTNVELYKSKHCYYRLDDHSEFENRYYEEFRRFERKFLAESEESKLAETIKGY